MMFEEKIVYIPLENVESEHCALIIEKGLASLKDISKHKVEINNKRVVISGKDTNALTKKAVQLIRDLGYGVSSIKKQFPVLNMSCASCANSTEGVLQMQSGVISANVNYANAMASIEYIPSLTNAATLKSALQSIGYDLMIDEKMEAKESLDDLRENNYRSLRRKTLGAIFLSIPLMSISMVPALMHVPYSNYLMWLFASPVLFFFGNQFFIGAYKQLRHRSANMDTLVALSTGVAYLFSIFNTLYPEYWEARGLRAHVYFETSAVVIAFILLGKLLEEKAKGNTSSAIKKLIGLQAKTVLMVLENGEHVQVKIESVKVGDTLLVKPGEKIAVDGEIISGHSFVDESMISGEPIPIEKAIHSKVFAGTINQRGSFQFKAQKVGGETLLSQIIQMVQEAQGSKAPVQKLVDKIASIFVPTVILISVLSFIIWFFVGGENGFTQGLLSMVTVLVIACPCALGLATPTAIMVGVGKGASKGILIKDAESLEVAKNINAIVLDKTGTITEGKPSVQEMKWFVDETKLLQDILFSIEKSSEHPLANAIVKELETKSNFIKDLTIENKSGRGIQGKVTNTTYFIGNVELLKDKGIHFSESVINWISEKAKTAYTVVLFSDSKNILTGICIHDKIKPTSSAAIDQLKKNKIEVYMLTGDNDSAAKAVSQQVGISTYKANVLPAEKSIFIKNLQAQGKIVAMVGDGINDSNALAQANVSIAMGKGSDIAIDVAKMAIISNDLLKINEAIHLSYQTSSTIKQNLFWAFIYNIIGIPLAAGILFPINGFLLNPMIAGAAMALSSVSVVSNSLLLKYKK